LKTCGKISEIFIVWIARYELSNSQKSFFGLAKKLGYNTSHCHICMKKCPKWWFFFGFIFHGKFFICLKNFRSFGIIQHIGKNKQVEKNRE